jgi:hypothetical protein
MTRLLRGVVLATLLCLIGTQARAQAPILPTNPRLQDVVRLAQNGYGDSARTLIAGILDRTAATDSLYPEALFTAGSVARSGDEMRADFARIVVEYPQSPWADNASLRLVQLAYGSGDMANVVSRVSRMFTDYAESPLIPAAALWGARAAFALQQMQQACDWITKGLARVGDDVELRNQLQFAKQRCAVGTGVQLAPVVPESLRAGPPPPPARGDTTVPPLPSTAHPRSPWRVQVIAIADKTVIRRMIGQIEAGGFKAYTVPGPRGLTKVQVGPFATRAAATAQLKRIKQLVGGSPFVAPAP